MVIAGRTALDWTLDRLLAAPAISTVTVALSAERLDDEPARLASASRARERLRFVVGGEHRQDSVARCLAASPAAPDDLVLVHDGGRPCLASEDLDRVVAAARRHGAAVLGRPVTDTLKRVRGEWIEGTVDRSDLFRAETPQVVRRADLERALDAAFREGLRATDEAGLLEHVGLRVRAVEARGANPKLTVAADLELIEQMLLRQSGAGAERRTG